MSFSTIRPFEYVAIRLPSGAVKVEQLLPNTTINLGKYGTFHSRSLLGRPYYLTFEVLDVTEQQDGKELRVVHAAEIHAETILEEDEPDLAEDESSSTPAAVQFDDYGLPATTEKSNMNIVDNPSNQKLTYADIEALKSDQFANPKELIAKIMANHSQLDQKTAFSLAKYTLRKQKKYMRRFTVLPLDVGSLTDWMMNEKDFGKVMEVRSETLGLISSWANVHASGPVLSDEDSRCRYLVVDDTGGLVVAALAEKMGILHVQNTTTHDDQTVRPAHADAQASEPSIETDEPEVPVKGQQKRQYYEHELALSNTLTLIHANQQPNLALLRYFSFDPTQPPSATTPTTVIHPLHTHLTTLTWLQLLHPESDNTYSKEPSIHTPEELSAMKPNQRSTYYRKRRRWQRIAQIIDSTRQGGFDALIIASHTNPTSICKHLIPLLRGGAQVVVYNPHIEPLMELCDVYSTSRRTAYIQRMQQQSTEQKESIDEMSLERSDNGKVMNGDGADQSSHRDEEELVKKFPVDPTLVLNFTIHHSVARVWQVLPGRTHPLMMGKGGAEGGYVAVATRVIPHDGGIVQARGRTRGKRRKLDDVSHGGSERSNVKAIGDEKEATFDTEMEGQDINVGDP